MLNYIPALIGGIIIGVAAGLYLLGNGRIMGVSGIVGAFASGLPGDWRERLAFVGMLLLSPMIYGVFFELPSVDMTTSVPLIAIAGLLVGFGSRLGSGCTSGHGVCGLGRFSLRSLVSVIVFLAVAIITVALQSKIWG